MSQQIDDLDVKVINILLQNANTPYSEIAKALEVSIGTIHVRIKKLEALQVIRYFSLEIDHTKLGYDLTAYLGVTLEKGVVYRDVIAALESVHEVTEAHYITGRYGLFLKICCKNTTHLRQLLNETIQMIPGVQSTETMISLEERIKRPLHIE